MEQVEGLSCQIPESLHARVAVERVTVGQFLSEYVTGLLTNYYEDGRRKDMAQTRTIAFQISEDPFQWIKDYLAHENERQDRKVTQKGFVIGLIKDTLERWEQGTTDADPSASADMLGPIDKPTDSAPSQEAEETEGGARNVAE